MIRWVGAMILAVGTLADTADARETIGVYRGWAAFADTRPRRCYALSAPAVPLRGAFAAVGNWPDRRVSGQVHVRFARAVRPGSAVLLTIDGRVFQLRERGADAWAPDATADRAIVAAMRTGIAMTIATRDGRGRFMADRYALTGAATAIDAAAIACRGRRS